MNTRNNFEQTLERERGEDSQTRQDIRGGNSGPGRKCLKGNN